LVRSTLAYGSTYVVWQDSKTDAVYIVDLPDADARDSAAVQEFDGRVFDHEIRFETPRFMHQRELDGGERGWYRIVRDLRRARCAGAPRAIATYRSQSQRPIYDEEYWTYAAAQRRVSWRLYWAGPTMMGLPLESFAVYLTPHGVPESVGVEYLGASEQGINLVETQTGSSSARSADCALRHADRIGRGRWLARGPEPTAARIGWTTISLNVELLGSRLTRWRWIAILRRLRPA